MAALDTYTALSVTTERSNGWAKLDIDTLSMVLLAHLVTAAVELIAVPGCSNGAACWESRDVVGEADAERAVLHAEGIKAEARNRTNVANARLALPSSAGGKVDLLEEGQLADKGLCLLIGRSPVLGGGFYPTSAQLAMVQYEVAMFAVPSLRRLWGVRSGARSAQAHCRMRITRGNLGIAGRRYVRAGVEWRALSIVQTVTARVVGGSRNPVGDLWELSVGVGNQAARRERVHGHGQGPPTMLVSATA